MSEPRQEGDRRDSSLMETLQSIVQKAAQDESRPRDPIVADTYGNVKNYSGLQSNYSYRH